MRQMCAQISPVADSAAGHGRNGVSRGEEKLYDGGVSECKRRRRNWMICARAVEDRRHRQAVPNQHPHADGDQRYGISGMLGAHAR